MSEEMNVDITKEVEQTAKMVWWILLIQGIIMLILGLMLLVHPEKTLIVMVTLLGTFWLINGILDIIVGIIGYTNISRGWMIFGGSITVTAGLIVLNHPLIVEVLATEFLAIVVAISIIINGLVQIFIGRAISFSDTELSRKQLWGSSLIGAIYVVGGVLLVTHPTWTAEILLILVGIWALVAGIVRIVIALRIRSATQDITANVEIST